MKTYHVHTYHEGKRVEASGATYVAAINTIHSYLRSIANGKADHNNSHTITRSTADADSDCTTAVAQPITRD